MGGLQNQINSNQLQANKGISSATSIAMMPAPSAGKTFSLGLGVGSYQGVSSVALGITANVYENVQVRAAATSNSAYGVGAGFSF